jgi:hypothetical protein
VRTRRFRNHRLSQAKGRKSLLFFEKKEAKKTLSPGYVAPAVPHTLEQKFFWFFFFKKRTSSFLNYAKLTAPSERAAYI